MKNKIKYLFLIIIILTLIFPRQASADFFGIVDLIATSLEGVEETAGPVAKVLITIFFSYLGGIIAAFTSAGLLQYATENPQWLSITQNDMVRSGWYFTSGIANIFIILILIFIAFSYILKIETVQAKQALPKLIIVALLINFSLVFVGMLVDISNMFFNAILHPPGLESNTGLPLKIVEKAGGGAWGIIMGLIITIVGLTVCFMIPIASTICQSSLVFGIVTLAFFPNFLTYILQIFFFFLLSGMFFTYAFLFGARVFVVELLAIISPFAFLCYILPQTKKYFDEWLQHLIQWLTFGIILFFFLTIGFKASNFIAPPPMGGGLLIPPPFNWFSLDQYVYYYFFLFVYLVMALWISKRFTPTIATVLIEQGKAFTGFVWTKGLKPVVRPAAQRLAERLAEPRVPPERVMRWAGREALTMGRGPVAATRRWMGRTLGPEVIEAEQRSFDKTEKQFTGKLYELKVSALLGEQNRTKRAGIIGAFSEDGEIEKLLRDDKAKNVLTDEEKKLIASKAGQVDRGNKVVKALLPKGTKEEQERWLEKIGIEEPKQWEKDAFKINTRLDKVVGKVKPANIKYFSSEALEGEGAQEAIHEFWHGAHISQAGLEFGKVFLNKFQEEANMRGIEWYQDHNPRMVKYFTSSPARALGLESPKRFGWEPPPGWTPPPDWKPGSPPPGWKPGTQALSGWTAKIPIPSRPSPRPRSITPGLATTEATLERKLVEEKILKAKLKELRDENASDQEKEIARATLENQREEIRKLKEEIKETEKT